MIKLSITYFFPDRDLAIVNFIFALVTMSFIEGSRLPSKLSAINQLTLEILKCDQHLISPLNITPESNIKVTRIKEMITNL